MNSSVDTAAVDVVDEVMDEVVASSPPQPAAPIVAAAPEMSAASVAVFPLIARRLAATRDDPSASR